MIAYRLTRSAYTKLDGAGAKKAGGRLNSKGIPLVYTGQSISLCVLEVAVHLPLGLLPLDYVLLTIEIPDDIPIKTIAPLLLPLNWRVTLHALETQQIGDDLYDEGAFCVMKVPSASIVTEHNYLINPNHPSFSRIQITNTIPFDFDSRLFVR